MQHIVSFSGGKDSTCMLLMMLDKGMPIDDIVFCDTGMEFPAMYQHIDKVEQYIGSKVTRLKAERGFDYWFREYRTTRGKYMDQKGKGWPNINHRWCTGALKRDVVKKYLRGKTVTEYHGIARDEPNRIKHNPGRNIQYPLYEWEITEAQALQYCYDRGFTWDGLYQQFRRVSCWCCPLQPLNELYSLYINYPELWVQLMEMNKYSKYSFKQDYTLDELNERFKQRSKQVTLW
jgi:3'-phosphoadenosine 5'-phosphosulfate sulfotransferase (PAPS reductase)/FAD synthetase